jgi:hypothetical protein
MKGSFDVVTVQGRAVAARLWELFWLFVLTLHALLGGCWLWLAPGGFGLTHPRFWTNSAAPLAALTLAIGSLAALKLGSKRVLRWLLPIWPAGWAAAALTGRVLFPISLAWYWLGPLGAAIIMGIVALPPSRGASLRERFGVLFACATAAVAGMLLMCAQHPSAPDTHPRGGTVANSELMTGAEAVADVGIIRLDRHATVYTADATTAVKLGSLNLSIDPLLTFLQGSKDGCWSSAARPRDREGPAARFRRRVHGPQGSELLLYEFPGLGLAELQVAAGPAGTTVISASTQVSRPVYSHLNSYCDIEVRGHHRLALEFSTCPGVAIEVRPFDYPFGRPSRFAFVERDRTFRVVEAYSGEKGPFRTLARGKLAEDDSLTITLLDEDKAQGQVTFDDWSVQADTTLSPTAGWGVPVNSIEFSLSGDANTAPASIFSSLASMSVGRGWDCVGHRPGVYLNRVRCEAVKGNAPVAR